MCAIVAPDPMALIQCVNSLVILLIQTRISDREGFLKAHLNVHACWCSRRRYCTNVHTYSTITLGMVSEQFPLNLVCSLRM